VRFLTFTSFIVVTLLQCAAAVLPTPTIVARQDASLLMKQARAAYNKNEFELAVALASKAIEAEPKNVSTYYTRAQCYEAVNQHEFAIVDYTKALEIDPTAADFLNLRGFVHFKIGQIDKSIADFDAYLRSKPAQVPYHWQRGISYYYAKRFQDGQRQFEQHQTVNGNDVENAVWHFLCVSRQDGVTKARSALIPINADPRVPMTQIYQLFAGKLDPAEVLKAAEAGQPNPGELKNRLFYAHLYLGLYFEAIGDVAKAKDHIGKAVGPYQMSHYMGDVARVHQKLRGWAETKPL
jgi:lipoprotein NlpI